MAVVMPPSSTPSPLAPINGTDHVIDTRTPSPKPRQPDGTDDDGGEKMQSDATPDLSAEIAMLSTKLINAINYQTNLDDTLQAARHALDRSQTELRRVQAEKQSLDDAVAQGALLKKAEVDHTMAQLRAELAQEKAKREAAERARKQTEGEVESLTSALFEEANTMVASARRDTDAAEKRTSQLRSQLQDTESLLASQQEQLHDLKLTMEKLEQSSTDMRDSSMPGTPIVNGATSAWDPLQDSLPLVDVPPDHPLHFSQLVLPVLRTDVGAYSDFVELLSVAKKAAPHSRTASGNLASASATHLATPAASSSPSLPGAFSFSSGNSSPSSTSFAAAAATPALKDSKFYKRTLVEDIEPTLRLDLAPGLTFLSRRTVLSSILNGSLAVEPFAQANYKFYAPVFACTLCGEHRKGDLYTRRHRFRTSESEDAQRHPLCDYCLGRIRATADFLGFLRMLRDGHWRCEGDEEEKGAWEEAVRLRERMFWARLAGGVVPAAVRREQLEAAEARSRADTAKAPSAADLSLEVPPQAKDIERSTTPLGEPEQLADPSAEEISPPVSSESQDEVESSAAQLQYEAAQAEEAIESPLESQPPPPVTPTLGRELAAPSSPERRHLPASPDTRRGSAASVRSQLSFHQARELSPTKLGRPPSSPSKADIANFSPRRSRELSPAKKDRRPSSPDKASAAPNGRRPSSVLDRVRAMEAKASVVEP